MHESTHCTSSDKKYAKEAKGNKTRIFLKDTERYRRNRYKEADYEGNNEWRKVIGHRYQNERIEIESVFPTEVESSNVEHATELSEVIAESISQQKAYAAPDASVKGGRMGAHWLITDEKKREILENSIFHRNSPPAQLKEPKQSYY